MIYSTEVQNMCPVAKGAYHGPAPIPEEGKWVQAKEIKDISGLTHGVGWCAPQQGACKLTLNIKDGIIEEALVETLGCSGMTHSAAMASEILIGKTLLEALNTDLVCDAINTAMRELFLQIVYGRSQTAFSEGGLPIGASLEDLGKGLRSQVGTMFASNAKGPRYLEMAEGYCTRMALNKDNEVIGYEFVHLGKMMAAIAKGTDANEALKAATGHYGQWDAAVKYIDPATNKRRRTKKWLCLKATREELTRSMVSSLSTASVLWRSAARSARTRALIPMRSSRAFSPSLLRTLRGLTAWVPPSPSRRA